MQLAQSLLRTRAKRFDALPVHPARTLIGLDLLQILPLVDLANQ
jgi:hypothetical protein